MAKLIVEDRYAGCDATIGGKPLAAPGTQWPLCRTCAGPMQFLAQLPLAESGVPGFSARSQFLLLFQCQNDPGMCDEWDADLGGNAAILVSTAGRQPLVVPEGEALLPCESRLAFQSYDDSATLEAVDDGYLAARQASPSQVLGKLGGRAVWIQEDETPACGCGKTMTFFAQLEDSGGGGVNFGDGGTGYAFVCRYCSDSAKFLWQC